MSAQTLKDSPLLLYQQVAGDLRSSIENDVYHEGHRIPSEAELSQLYSVSRITVRKAIEQLVDEGLLVKRQGKGTFVQPRRRERVILDDRSSEINGFSVSCRKNGFVPGAQLLRREVVSVPEGEREFFGDEVEELIAIDRIRTADGSPIMVEYNLFPRAGLEFLETELLGDASLFKLIRERTDRRAFRGSEQSLGIQLANDELAKLLEVPLAEPLFNLRGRYRDQFNKPLYVGQQYIIGSRYTFSM